MERRGFRPRHQSASMGSGLYPRSTVLFREGLQRIIRARVASSRALAPTIKAETALDGGRGFMRILALFVVSIVLTSAVCVAGSHASKAPWPGNSSAGHSSSANPTPQDCLPIAEASKHVRKQTCVTGTVIHVEDGGHGVTFLDFCVEYRNCPFTVVVFPGSEKNRERPSASGTRGQDPGKD